MGEHDYVTRGSSFTDDSSTTLGLTHDSKGRRIVALPAPETGYDPELVDKSPDEMAEIIAQREDDRDGNNIEKLISEHPGGRPPGTHSSSAKGPKKPKPSFDPHRPDPFEGKGVLRPHMASGRVDTRARNALYAQPISPGEMFNTLGMTLAAGVTWQQIEYALNSLALKEKTA